MSLVLDAEVSSWLVTVGPEGARLTAAGWWCALVSSPLFWFLLLRWLWRHAVWGLLLRDLARLELRLVATHPDGAGGLAFIGQYPNAFAAFVLALSCVLGAAIARTLLQGELTTAAYGQLMAAWLVVVIILFGLPLLAFSSPLRRLKHDRSGRGRRAPAAGRRRRHPAAGEGAAQNRSWIAAVMTRCDRARGLAASAGEAPRKGPQAGVPALPQVRSTFPAGEHDGPACTF